MTILQMTHLYKHWTPWANTYMYYPLTSDLKDVMWNWNTGTMHWTCTFNSSTGIHVTWKSGNYVTWMTCGIANRNTFTFLIWSKIDAVNTSNYDGILWWYNSTSASRVSTQMENNRWSSWNYLQPRIFYWNSGFGTDITPDTNRHLYTFTGDGTSYKIYIDGELKNSVSTSTKVNNITEFQLWWGWYFWSGRSENWYIKDYIVETVARTAQEVADYYNLTKWNYWL